MISTVKNQGLFVKHGDCPRWQQSPKSYFSFKVKLKVTRSYVSFETVSLVEYIAKYEVSISYGSNGIAKVKVDNRQTDKQRDRQTNKQTNRQDRNNMPPIIRSGGIKYYKIKMSNIHETNNLISRLWQNIACSNLRCVSWLPFNRKLSIRI